MEELPLWLAYDKDGCRRFEASTRSRLLLAVLQDAEDDLLLEVYHGIEHVEDWDTGKIGG